MIASVRVVGPHRLHGSAIGRVDDTPPRPTLCLSLQHWSAPDADLLEFDALIHRQEDRGSPFRLQLEGLGASVLIAARQVLTRYQRLLPINNGEGILRAVLPVHRGLFELSKPLVRADYDHALDTWRWLLRLDRHAGVALQLAALFHDVERLTTEADSRREHLADDYLAFKRGHASRGSKQAEQLLGELGLDVGVIARVSELIRNHEQPGWDDELLTLNDADALSFFSLNSWGFYRYFGEEHTRKKVHYTLKRMRNDAKALLPALRLHLRVAEFAGVANGLLTCRTGRSANEVS